MRSWWRPHQAPTKGNLLVSISSTHSHQPLDENLQALLWGVLETDKPSISSSNHDGWEFETDEPTIHEEMPINFDRMLFLVSIESVSVGAGHIIFVAKEGRAFAYGCNGHGQLGLGDFESRSAPCQVQGLSASPHPGSPMAGEGSGQSWDDVQEGPQRGSTGAWGYVSMAACGQ